MPGRVFTRFHLRQCHSKRVVGSFFSAHSPGPTQLSAFALFSSPTVTPSTNFSFFFFLSFKETKEGDKGLLSFFDLHSFLSCHATTDKDPPSLIFKGIKDSTLFRGMTRKKLRQKRIHPVYEKFIWRTLKLEQCNESYRLEISILFKCVRAEAIIVSTREIYPHALASNFSFIVGWVAHRLHIFFQAFVRE